MIDLHLHTTASDGTDSPAGLIAACLAAGLSTIAVTDHDTMSAVPEAARAASDAGIALVPGIEITAAWRGNDVHVLGYFLDPGSPELRTFLEAQREDRIRRARSIAERLAALGAPIDIEALIRRMEGRPLLRPHLARAIVDAGHAVGQREAFDRYIGEGRPAFVARSSAAPAEVVGLIRTLGGTSSLAHPGVTRQDALIPELAAAGLDALEVYYTEHTAEDTARYRGLAERLGLALTGGSDYHGAQSDRRSGFGAVSLPAADFSAFCRRRDWGQSRL